MTNWYYKIWADAISHEKSKKVEGRNFKLYTLVPMSLLQGFNLLTFFYWMKVIVNRHLPLFFDVDIFNAKPLNGFISVLITLFIPFVILNYLLIYNNDRYERIVAKYPGHNGQLYSRYALFSLGLLIIPILIQKIYFAT